MKPHAEIYTPYDIKVKTNITSVLASISSAEKSFDLK
jgi:hypothetical protein